ncbi:MAG: hypothetical protein V1854_04895 [Methanobacteriota archaeon]
MFEGLKKLWQEAKKKAEDSVIKMSPVFEHEHDNTPVDLSEGWSPPSIGTVFNGIDLNRYPYLSEGCPPSGNEQTPIDKEIAALVAEMNRVGIHTTCSCQGDVGQDGAYISITFRWRRQG